MSKTLERRLAFRGAAVQMIESRRKEVLISGSAGTGKTVACLTKAMLLALMWPGMRGLFIRKTAASLSSTVLVTWREHVIVDLLASGAVTYYGGSAEEPPQYRFDNGSRIMIGGMDKPQKIMSSEYDLIYAAEAVELTPTDWELATTRLRNGVIPWQQMLADCNPSYPTHFLKRRADEGKLQLLISVHEDNPGFFDQNPDGTFTPTVVGRAYMEVLDALTGVRYLRLRKGLWAAAEGMIYEHWDPAQHLVDPFEIPDSWPRYWSVDFGFRHPMVIQMWAERPTDGALLLYREVYRAGRTVPEVAAEALALVTDADGKWTEPQPLKLITDHQLAERFSLEHALDMGSTPAHKVVTEGIQAVQARLGKPATDTEPAVAPRLFIVRGATAQRDQGQADAMRPCSTEEEIVGYVWADGLKEQPVKEDDDGMDAMRYMVADRDFTPEPNIRIW